MEFEIVETSESQRHKIIVVKWKRSEGEDYSRTSFSLPKTEVTDDNIKDELRKIATPEETTVPEENKVDELVGKKFTVS